MNYAITTIALMYTLLAGCSKQIIEPELFGAVEGTVIDSDTNSGISDASIETTPATEAILTDAEGYFRLKDIPAGSYLIKAAKTGAGSASVSITVREDHTATATIVLNNNGQQAASKHLRAEVTSWFQSGQPDSSFVDVEYKISNTSTSTVIREYEVYFNIYTNQENFHYEVSEAELHPRESNFGAFTKYLRDRSVDSVVVAGTWAKG